MTDIIEKADADVLERDTSVYTLATARLSRPDIPADLLAVIDLAWSVIAGYDDISAFDLEPVCPTLSALREATAEFIADAGGHK
jgi:hypothetical protein